MDEPLSPRLQQQVVALGIRLRSFKEARAATRELLEIELTTKMVERLTERIGDERVAERDAAVVAWKELPLMGKLAAPPGATGRSDHPLWKSLKSPLHDRGRRQNLALSQNAAPLDSSHRGHFCLSQLSRCLR